MLVVASIFRDSERYVDRYFQQIEDLRRYMPLRLVIAEGDSTDDTLPMLEERVGKRDTLLKVDHGGPKFGSEDEPQRWSQIAYVCNTVLDHLDLKDDDRLLYVESDLGWTGHAMATLVTVLDVVGAAAAMSFHTPTEKFYDVWGHTGLDGERFTHEPPYHKSLEHLPPGRMTAIGTAGSCIAVRGSVVNAGVRFSDEDCIRGFCRTIRDHTTLWLHTGVEVWHG